MCSFPAVASVALETFGNYSGQKAQAAAAQAAMDAQAKAAITEMNYAFQNFEQERTDAFDAAVAEISKARINALQLNSGVKAAVNEGMSGRTANLLVRSVEGDTARAVGSVKDNYARRSNEIDLNKEMKYKSTKDFIQNLNASAPKMPSRFENFLATAGSALSTYTMAQNQKNLVKSKGMKYNWWTGGAKVDKKLTKGLWVGNVPQTVHQRTGAGIGRYVK